MEAYCTQCKYTSDIYGTQYHGSNCKYPDNITIISSPFRSYKSFISSQQLLNKNNDCKWFKRQNCINIFIHNLVCIKN